MSHNHTVVGQASNQVIVVGRAGVDPIMMDKPKSRHSHSRQASPTASHIMIGSQHQPCQSTPGQPKPVLQSHIVCQEPVHLARTVHGRMCVARTKNGTEKDRPRVPLRGANWGGTDCDWDRMGPVSMGLAGLGLAGRVGVGRFVLV